MPFLLAELGESFTSFVDKMFLIIFSGIAIAICYGCIAEWVEKKKKKFASDAMEIAQRWQQEQQQLQLEANRQLEEQAHTRQREGEEQLRLAVTQAVNAVRETAVERYKPGALAGPLAERDEYLKESRLMNEHVGRMVTVRVMASPTGRISLEWMVDPRIQRSLKIVCQRQDKSIAFVDYGPRGVFHDTILRGQDHWFAFHAYDGSKDEEPDFGFTVKIETRLQRGRQVDVPPPKPAAPSDTLAARVEQITKTIEAAAVVEETVDRLRSQIHQQIDASEGSETDKKKRKAAADASIIAIRDKEP